MTEKVRVAGVGIIPFSKPGRSRSYPDMSERAARAALDDAGIPHEAVQQAYAGYVDGTPQPASARSLSTAQEIKGFREHSPAKAFLCTPADLVHADEQGKDQVSVTRDTTSGECEYLGYSAPSGVDR